jgi:phage gpG-like protein
MKKAGLLLFKDVQKHFDREEGPDGKWKPLSPKTANAFVTKNKRRGYQHILVNTGQLKGSFLHDATKFSARTYSQIADKNYGIQHEQGTKFIPQRRFMWMSDEAKENIIEVLKMHFQSEN